MNRSVPGHDPVLNLLHAPVTIIGAARDGILGGLTAAWISRVSTDPPRLLVAIAPQRFTHGLIRGSGYFSVSILKETQVPEARLFGMQSRREVDKWAQVPHVLMTQGVPALAVCAGRLLCRTEAVFPVGDHDCFSGEVLLSELVAGAPVLPMRGSDYRP